MKISYQIEVAIKFFIKKLAKYIPVNYYQRLSAFSIIYNEFSSLQSTPKYNRREELWALALKICSAENNFTLSYVEFGVLEGYSINWFSSNLKKENATFFGLDSFVGLPEDWDNIPKGTLSVEGKIPTTNDKRIIFLKGIFLDTTATLLQLIKERNPNVLIVNFDADLYSSTLYALTEIDKLKLDYLAIFDEFAGHESRALYNYTQSHGAKVKFLGRVLFNNEPWCVLCKIETYKPKLSDKNIY